MQAMRNEQDRRRSVGEAGTIGPQTTDTREAIRRTMDALRDLLLEKNRRYGDSALKPPRVFAKTEATGSIAVRLDDKLARVANSDEPRKNDVADLMGYLGLYCVARGWESFDELLD